MKRRVLWLCVVVFFFACDAAGPAETQSRRQPLHLDTLSFSRLELPNTGYEDLYGAALAMTGDWLFVSAPGDDPFGPGTGGVFIYRWNGGAWVRTGHLTQSALSFGEQIVADGDRLVVASSRPDVVWVYELDNGAWTFVSQFFASGVIATHAERIAVGGGSSGGGFVDLYQRHPDGSWALETRISSTDPGFGNAIALSDRWLVIGAEDVPDSSFTDDAGSVTIYDLDSPTYEMVSFRGDAGTRKLGASVAVDGDRVVAGAPRDIKLATFEFDGATWQRSSDILVFRDPQAYFYPVASSLSLVGDSLVVGSGLISAVDFYKFDGATWQSSGGFQSDSRLGAAVAQSGDRVVAGMPYADLAGTNAGALLAFENHAAQPITYANDEPGREVFQTSTVTLTDDVLLVRADGEWQQYLREGTSWRHSQTLDPTPSPSGSVWSSALTAEIFAFTVNSGIEVYQRHGATFEFAHTLTTQRRHERELLSLQGDELFTIESGNGLTYLVIYLWNGSRFEFREEFVVTNASSTGRLRLLVDQDLIVATSVHTRAFRKTSGVWAEEHVWAEYRQFWGSAEWTVVPSDYQASELLPVAFESGVWTDGEPYTLDRIGANPSAAAWYDYVAIGATDHDWDDRYPDGGVLLIERHPDGTLGTAGQLIPPPEVDPSFAGKYVAASSTSLAVSSGHRAVLLYEPTSSLTAHSASAVTDEDLPVTVDVAWDGGAGTVGVVTPPSHGNVTIAGDDLVYDPAPDFFGTDAFSYSVTDGLTAPSIAWVEVEVVPVDDPPVGADQTVTTLEDDAVWFDLDVSEPDGEQLAATILNTTVGVGRVTGTRASYVPPAEFSGTAEMMWEVTDGVSTVGPWTATIIVENVDDPPVFVEPSPTSPIFVDFGEVVSFRVAVTDEDSDVAAVLVGRDDATFDAATGEFQWTAILEGLQQFHFEASDGTTTSTLEVEVWVSMRPTEPPPTEVDMGTTDFEDMGTHVTIDVGREEADVSQPDVAVIPEQIEQEGGCRAVSAPLSWPACLLVFVAFSRRRRLFGDPGQRFGRATNGP